jgi:hypothetical protein
MLKISPAKQIANIHNAKLSTGPKSLRGKGSSSQNATKHGLNALTVVLPQLENARDWKAHLAGVEASLHPTNHLEGELVHRIAGILWRLHRVVRHETKQINLRSPNDALLAGGTLECITRYESHLQRQLISTVATLEHIRSRLAVTTQNVQQGSVIFIPERIPEYSKAEESHKVIDEEPHPS